MILVNRNFGNPVLSSVIGDMFKGSSDVGQNVGKVLHTNTLASGSSLVAQKVEYALTTSSANSTAECQLNASNIINRELTSPQNFFLVTEHFLKTLDKVYTKIWNESFTETGIYVPANLATMFNGLATNTSLNENSTTTIIISAVGNTVAPNIMLFKKFVDRCITAGILAEEDRLQYEDQISLTNLNRVDLSTQIDLDNKLITFTMSQPIDIKPDLNGLAGEYLAGKKLFLMMTPYLPNESTIKNSKLATSGGNPSIPTPTSLAIDGVNQEPFYNLFGCWSLYDGNRGGTSYPVKQPLAFFKPKTDASKFGRSLPLGTHLIWSIGTPEDKALAETNGTTPPDLVFDHLDRISHIDSLVLKIKFDKLQF